MQTQFNPTIISINQGEDKSITLSIPWGSSLDDWKTVFKTILISQTFVEDQLKELFGEYEEDY